MIYISHKSKASLNACYTLLGFQLKPNQLKFLDRTKPKLIKENVSASFGHLIFTVDFCLMNKQDVQPLQVKPAIKIAKWSAKQNESGLLLKTELFWTDSEYVDACI